MFEKVKKRSTMVICLIKKFDNPMPDIASDKCSYMILNLFSYLTNLGSIPV